MKFYVLDTNPPQFMAALKLAAGEKPDSLHQEYFLPPSGFFIVLPNNLLTTPLKSRKNEKMEERSNLRPNTRWFEKIVTDINGKEHFGDLVTYENHFNAIPHLRPIKTSRVVQEKYRKPIYVESADSPGLKFISHYVDDVRDVIIENKLAPFTAYETIVCSVMNDPYNHYYIGHSTYSNRPDVLFITKDLIAIQALLLGNKMTDGSELNQYVQWEWYSTTDLSAFLQYTVDLLAKKSLLDKVQLLNNDGTPLLPVTFGPKAMSELTNIILNELQVNLGGKTAVAIEDYVHDYYDQRVVSLCDVALSSVPPSQQTLHLLDISTDKAYVRSGLCGLVLINYSPVGRMLVPESAHRAADEDMSLLITDIPEFFSQVYILAKDGLYFISNRDLPVSVDNLIGNSADHNRLAQLWDAIMHVSEPGNYRTQLLDEEKQATITRLTNHARPFLNQLHFINKSINQCELIKDLTPAHFQRLDDTLNISIRSPKSSVLLHTQLAAIKRVTGHDYQAVVEEEKMQLEEPVAATVAPVVILPTKANIGETYKAAIIQLRTAIALKKPDKYSEEMGKIPAADRTAVYQEIAKLYQQRRVFHAQSLIRLAEYNAAFQSDAKANNERQKLSM